MAAKKKRETRRRHFTVVFSNDGTPVDVIPPRGATVREEKLPLRDITLSKLRSVSVVVTQHKGSRTCCVWIGGIPKCWSC